MHAARIRIPKEEKGYTERCSQVCQIWETYTNPIDKDHQIKHRNHIKVGRTEWEKCLV